MKETTLMKYVDYRGERVKVTFAYGQRRGIVENFDKDGFPKEDTHRNSRIREVRIYEGSQLYESIKVNHRSRLPALNKDLQQVMEQALEVDEVALIIKEALGDDIDDGLCLVEFIDRYYTEDILKLC